MPYVPVLPRIQSTTANAKYHRRRPHGCKVLRMPSENLRERLTMSKRRCQAAVKVISSRSWADRSRSRGGLMRGVEPGCKSEESWRRYCSRGVRRPYPLKLLCLCSSHLALEDGKGALCFFFASRGWTSEAKKQKQSTSRPRTPRPCTRTRRPRL